MLLFEKFLNNLNLISQKKNLFRFSKLNEKENKYEVHRPSLNCFTKGSHYI